MTVQTVGWVLDHSESRGYARLVLISLANHANKFGADCRPSLMTIAAEAKVSRSSAWRAIEALERTGELLVRRGIGRGNVSDYVLTMNRAPSDCLSLFDHPDPMVQVPTKRAVKGVTAEQLPAQDCSAQAEQSSDLNVPEKFQKSSATRAARVLIRPSDSIEPQNHRTERERAGGNGAVSAAAPAPVPDRFVLGAAHYDFGAELGIPRDRIETETRKFLAHHGMHGNRRRNWEQAWQKWMLDVPGFERAKPTPKTTKAPAATRSNGAASTVVSRADGPAQRRIIGRD